MAKKPKSRIVIIKKPKIKKGKLQDVHRQLAEIYSILCGMDFNLKVLQSNYRRIIDGITIED